MGQYNILGSDLYSVLGARCAPLNKRKFIVFLQHVPSVETENRHRMLTERQRVMSIPEIYIAQKYYGDKKISGGLWY